MAESDLLAQLRALVPRYRELAGQVAVVTGGANGIGLGIVLRLVREGMRVVIADKDTEALDAVAGALSNAGATILPFAGDLSQPETIRQLFAQTMQTFAQIDLLVNNAADLKRRRLLDEHEELLALQLATNIRAPYLCSTYAAQIMRANGGGNIVHVSSVGAIRAHERGLPYDVTKGAINALTRAMAIDLAEYNIRVNAIGPGATRTKRTLANDDPRIAAVSARIPLGRFGSVAEMSAVVAFLASSEASYITGQVIYVDGGITAQLSPPGQTL